MTTRYLVRSRYPKREGRTILGVATGPRPPAYQEAVLLPAPDGTAPTGGTPPEDAAPPDDAEPALTVTPKFRRQQRRGTHVLEGPLGGGATVERQGYQRFLVRDVDGREEATIRIRTLPHRLRIEPVGGAPVQVRNRLATKNPFRGTVREVAGGLLATWEGDERVRIECHAYHGIAEVEEATWPTHVRVALVAACIGIEITNAPGFSD